MHNPYTDQNFFSFFVVLLRRIYLFISGNLPNHELASDELQIVVLSGVAISSALVGTFLVLRRMTMLANSLSHTILLGIVITYLWIALYSGQQWHTNGNVPTTVFLCAAVMTALLTTFVTQFLTYTVKLHEDASIGLVFTSFFALGIILVTLFTRNVHIGAEVIMGNADLLHQHDLILPWLSTAINFVLFFLLFKEFQVTSFDPAFAQTLGFSLPFFNYLLMTQVSITLIGSFRAVGILLALAFVVGPVLLAQLMVHRLQTLLWLSSVCAMTISCIGVALSRHLLTVYAIPLSTAGIVVCVLLFCYVLLIALIFFKRRIQALTLAKNI